MVSLRLKMAVSMLIFLIALGTFFYHSVEGWSYVDSFYFTSITMTSVGYGDLHPSTDFSKIFTSLFAIVGIAMALYSLTVIGSDYFETREKALVKALNERDQQQEGKLNILAADRHIMEADKHVMELLNKIDKRIKK